jgi:dolichol-phosphate mannosyltransferase
VFASNVLEHVADKVTLLGVLAEARRVLRPGGELLVLGPNIRYVPGAYWDFYDHHIPLTDASLSEALEMSGFSVVERIKRFLPYTTKSRLANLAFLVPLYLKLRPLWSLFGAQMFVRGRKL